MKIGRLALVFALLAAGCSNDTTTAPTTPTTPATATVLFSGLLPVQGSASSSPLAIAQAGTIEVTLASLTTSNTFGTTSPPVTATVGLGIGTVAADGVSCTVNTSVNAVPGLAAQLSASLPIGTSCVQIFDIGNLAPLGPLSFVIRIVHT